MSFRSRTRTPGIFYFPGFPNGVKWLLISNVAVFILGFFLGLARLDGPLRLLALIPIEVIKNFFIWQLATYLFLHGGFGHIIWNMLALWMFGADLERVWGTRKFLQFYVFCGIGAGICVVLANFLLPWGNPRIPTIGSSGAIFGIQCINDRSTGLPGPSPEARALFNPCPCSSSTTPSNAVVGRPDAQACRA